MWRSIVLWTGVVLAAGSLAMWVASLWEVSYRANAWSGLNIALWKGELRVIRGGTGSSSGLSALYAWPPRESFAHARWLPEDAWFGRYTISGVLNWWSLELPLWVPCAAGACLAAGTFPAWRRHRSRVRDGRCRACGYDVRGLKSICPECGGAISPRRDPSPR